MINAGQATIPISTVRISVVDASGKKVFDELIKTDDEGGDVCVIPPPLASRRVHFRVVDLPPQGFEYTLLRHSPGRICDARGTSTSRVCTTCVKRAHRCGYNPDWARLDNDLRAPHFVHRRVVDMAALFSHPRA